MKKILAGLALAILAGCAGTGGVSKEALTTSHVACLKQQQKGCLELRVLNFAFNAEEEAMKGLDKPATSEEERQRRVRDLAPAMWKKYQAGGVEVSEPRDFLILVFGAKPVSLSQLSAYQVHGSDNKTKHTVQKVKLEDVTGKFKVPQFDSVSDLGAPTVYRIRADGPVPLGASIQFPWTMRTDRTHILSCSLDGKTVYPSKQGGNQQGLWTTPASFDWLEKNGETRAVQVFFSEKK